MAFSRFSYIELSIQKRTDDVYRGLINGFRFFGGVPSEIVFDNMPTVANVTGKQKKKTEGIKKIAKDFNFKVRLCATRAPETKGCVEAKNKVIDWIRPYDGEFEDLDDLTRIMWETKEKEMFTKCTAEDVIINKGMSVLTADCFYGVIEYEK